VNESDRSERPPTRFSLASFGDEAVLLDLESSGYFMVNRSAERIFRILIEEGQRDSVERRVAAELRISDLSARAAVEDVMRQLAAPPARLSFPGPFTYLPLENCYQLSIEGRPILDIRKDGRSARRPHGLPAPIPLAHTLRVAAPKLLSHSGLTVLHASACQTSSGLTAFCGLSGAGKTTTARAFATEGMELFCEDLIVLAPPGADSRPRALVGAEKAAHGWAREAAARTGDGEEIDCSDLPGLVVAPGQTVALTRIIFIDVSRRTGDAITVRRMRPAEALVQILLSNFVGSADRSNWESYFQRSAMIVRSAEMSLATMPAGIDKLPAAIRRYRESSAS
jgi:hypothetical protein